ncbi:ABC transporter ATP-binding protein [Amphibacillus sediminis]|uniref:ABC transporter ATP-binding protein n=1 Tax=Amphibacillus sediminis TaxID=360185 RepID=UPI00082A1D31|nr:ABC transporter ATP-binding protein [Amphibacillus sediminis]
MNLIETNQVNQFYGNHQVIHDLNLSIPKHKLIALIGPNGAGKSTTIALLLGLIKPTAGTITYWEEAFHALTGVQLQSTPLFSDYTVEENIKLFASFYRIDLTEELLTEKLASFDLVKSRKTQAAKLSIGQQKRLAIALTTIHQPELVILDEPTAGLDPKAQKQIRNMLISMKDEGVTVLFSSHDMEEVTQIADYIIMLNHGEIVAQGIPTELVERHQAKNLEELFFQFV